MSVRADRLVLSRRRRLPPEALILTAVVAVLAWCALVPLGYLVGRAVIADGRLTFDRVRLALGEEDVLPMLGNSLGFALGATVLAAAAGTVLAYLVERTDLPCRRLVLAVALVPMILPGVLYTIAWIFVGAPRTGALNTLLEPVVGPEAFDVFSLPGMILVEGLHLAPIALLIMVAAFRSLDPALEESARMSAAGGLTLFRRVSLPLVRPALGIAVLVLLVRSLEAFEVPALLGMPGDRWLLTSRIWQALTIFPPDYARASVYSLVLLVLTAFGVYLHGRFSRRGRRFETVTGRGFRVAPISLRGWRWPVAWLVTLYLLIAVVLPLVALVYVSLQPFYAAPSLSRLADSTLANYRDVLSDRDSLSAATNSAVLAAGAATVVVVLGVFAAWIVVRSRVRGRWLVGALAFVPLVMPGVVLGEAILFAYLRLPLPVYGTLLILLIAYVTRYLPYGIASATGSMHQLGSELEESARASGAGWWSTFRRVVIPSVAPGLLAGWIVVAILAVRELSSSILLYSPGDEVLAIRVWEEFQNGRFGEVGALGVLMTVALVPLIAVAYALGSRVGVPRR